MQDHAHQKRPQFHIRREITDVTRCDRQTFQERVVETKSARTGGYRWAQIVMIGIPIRLDDLSVKLTQLVVCSVPRPTRPLYPIQVGILALQYFFHRSVLSVFLRVFRVLTCVLEYR